MDLRILGNFFEGRRTKFDVARLRRFLSEAPVFFIAVVIGVALTFKVAIGWAKSASATDPEKDPTVATTAQPAAEASAGKTATPIVTAEPRPAATATVPSTPRKKPRPRH
jgi:hypothetical protein